MIKKTYGFCEIFDNDSTTRMVVPTDYAHAMGAFKHTPTDTWYQYHGENGYWWLRTPGYGTDYAMDCLLGGTGDYYGSRVNKDIYGVVPALYLNLSSDLWSMKEDGVHLGGGEGGGKSTDTETETQKPGDGSAKQTEIAIPGKVTIGSAKNNKKGTVTIKIKTKKTDPKVEGYEVVSAISKKKLSKVKKGKTFKKASIKLTKLKKGKTYFIKVRAFNKDAEGKNVYGEWSKVIKIKVKK